ncbi:MAG: CocE/NonD family hydrolase [Pseudonocardiaceae bacterium]
MAAVMVALLGAATDAASCSPPSAAGPCAVTRTTNVAVPMRDGTTLRADVYRPATPRSVPVILMRTQYGKEDAQVEPSRYQRPGWFAAHCYLVVVQDIRGQGASGARSRNSPTTATMAMTASSGPRDCPDRPGRLVCTDRPMSARPSGWPPRPLRRI